MRGHDHQQADMYSYLSPEQRVRESHPLRKIRAMADEALKNMSDRFDSMYAKTGRPSIPPEKLPPLSDHLPAVFNLASIAVERD